MQCKLKPVDLSRYLNFDLISVIEISFLLTGHEPVDINEFFQNQGEYPEQRKIYEMAKASITAKKIEGQGSHLCFAATPMTWISWAESKELKLPKVFRKAYDEYKEKEKEPAPRSSESYRPIREIEDKYVIQQVMLAIREFIPDLPLGQLVKTPPIQRIARDATDETLAKWGREVGITTKKGRPSDETKQECIKLMPKIWNFKWEDEIS